MFEPTKLRIVTNVLNVRMHSVIYHDSGGTVTDNHHTNANVCTATGPLSTLKSTFVPTLVTEPTNVHNVMKV